MRSPALAAYAIVLLATAAIAFRVGDSRRRAPDADTAAAPAGVPAGWNAADAVDELLRQPTEFSFTQATFALAAESTASELEAYIEEARGAANTRRGVAIANIMLSAYVELDPEAAFTFARQAPVDMRGTELFRVFADWSAIDQDAAVAAVARLRDPRERRAAEDGILQTALTQGPESVGVMADRLGRTDANAAALQLRTQDDPVAAIDAARRLPQTERLTAVTNIGGRWAAQDPEAAYAYADSLPVDTVRDFMMRSIFATWSRSQPERVVEILDGGVAPNDRDAIIDFGIAEMARIDAARTFALVADMRNAPMRAAAMRPLLQVWASDDPYAAVAALETLTTPDVRDLATIVGPLFARVAPQPAVDWAIGFDQGYGTTWRYVMGEVARRDIGLALLLARQTPEERQTEALILVVGSGAQANPVAAARALDTLPAQLRDVGTQHVVTEWIKRDAMAAQRWLMSQPRGRDRDSGLEALTRDPNTAADQLAALVNAIDSEPRRVAVARSLVAQRFRGDPAAARSLLNQLTLPQEDYEQLQRMLDGVEVPGDSTRRQLLDLR